MRRLASLFISAFVLGACGGGGAPGDAGVDATSATTCHGAADGTACGDGHVCANGSCAPSTCGDGILDTRSEQCDDGNAVAFDGCEPDCQFTCMDDHGCNDGNACNGTETCPTSTHACAMGTPLDDGAACSMRDGSSGVCGGHTCLMPGCGNGVVETGEDCDDGNDDPSDGCTRECTFTCTDDASCQDVTVCNGMETCDLTSHTCMAGTAPTCDDGSPCTNDSCDDVLGCVTNLIDMDGDGHAPDTLGSCGDDCDDTRADVYTGAPELCDGRDNNCNGSIDETAPTWYVDCDGDGYATDVTSSRTSCTAPDASAAGCSPGGWTTIRPVDASTTDCAETDPALNPSATEIPGDEVDQNCDGMEICYLDADNDTYRRPDGHTITSMDTDCRDMNEATASQPDTDCCDTDARAQPGQTAFYGSARSGCGGFDYDCDGAETPQSTATGACVCPYYGSNSSVYFTMLTEGWQSTPPGCGLPGPYWNPTSCPPTVGPSIYFCPTTGLAQVQACR